MKSGAHSPHDVGHSLSMKSGAVLHSPSLAQFAQCSERSEQMTGHTPQLCGQRSLTTSSVSHMPSRDQPAHETSLSLQKPMVAVAMSGSARASCSIMRCWVEPKGDERESAACLR